MKRFQINTPVLFSPPNPSKVAGGAVAVATMPTFNAFFQSYFGSAPTNLKNPACTSFLSGMKKCFENNPASANASCAYYVDGFKRMSCAAQ